MQPKAPAFRSSLPFAKYLLPKKECSVGMSAHPCMWVKQHWKQPKKRKEEDSVASNGKGYGKNRQIETDAKGLYTLFLPGSHIPFAMPCRVGRVGRARCPGIPLIHLNREMCIILDRLPIFIWWYMVLFYTDKMNEPWHELNTEENRHLVTILLWSLRTRNKNTLFVRDFAKPAYFVSSFCPSFFYYVLPLKLGFRLHIIIILCMLFSGWNAIV